MTIKLGDSAAMDGEFTPVRVLKKDLFGQIEQGHFSHQGQLIHALRRRVDVSPWWTKPLARWLMRREANILSRLDGIRAVPQVLASGRDWVLRSWLDGEVMYLNGVSKEEYFQQAFSLLCSLHRRGVAHNDSAKEANWLVLKEGTPALIDFQIARFSKRRSKLWRISAREDIRHLLKHKRTYFPKGLTSRELAILNTPSLPSKLWRATGKKLYLFITRRIFKWSDREGAGDRGRI